MSALNGYPYQVAPLPSEDGGGFVVSFLDFPGLLGTGETQDEAIEDAEKALFACLDAFKAIARKPPTPSEPVA